MRSGLERVLNTCSRCLKIDSKEFKETYLIALKKVLKHENITYSNKVYWDREDLTNRAMITTMRYYRMKNYLQNKK